MCRQAGGSAVECVHRLAVPACLCPRLVPGWRLEHYPSLAQPSCRASCGARRQVCQVLDKMHLALTLRRLFVSMLRQMFALLLLSGLAAPGGKGLWSDMFNPCKLKGALLVICCRRLRSVDSHTDADCIIAALAASAQG